MSKQSEIDKDLARFDAIAIELRAAIEASGLSATAYTRSAGVDTPGVNGFMNRKRRGMSDESFIRLALIAPEGSDLRKRFAAEIAALPVPATTAAGTGAAVSGVIAVPFGKLLPNPDNYRKTFTDEDIEALAASILDKGVLQNLVGHPADKKGFYQINSGGRRYAALKRLREAGQIDDDYPVPYLPREMDEAEARALAIVENIQRQDVPVMEEAEGFHALAQLGWAAARIADTCKLSLRTVQDRLQLIERLQPVARDALNSRQITLDQARAIMSVRSEAEQAEMVTHATRHDYTASALRDMAKRGKPSLDAAAFDLAKYEGEFLGEGKNRVFADREQFDKLQRAEAENIAAELRQACLPQSTQRRFAQVTLLRPGETFNSWEYRKTDDPAKATAFVWIEPWSHKIKIAEGYTPREADEEADEENDERTQATPCRQGKAEQAARDALAENFTTMITAHYRGKPADLIRLCILAEIVDSSVIDYHGPTAPFLDAMLDTPELQKAVCAALGLEDIFATRDSTGQRDPDSWLPITDHGVILAVWQRLLAMAPQSLLSLLALLATSGMAFRANYGVSALELLVTTDAGIPVPDFMAPTPLCQEQPSEDEWPEPAPEDEEAVA